MIQCRYSTKSLQTRWVIATLMFFATSAARPCKTALGAGSLPWVVALAVDPVAALTYAAGPAGASASSPLAAVPFGSIAPLATASNSQPVPKLYPTDMSTLPAHAFQPGWGKLADAVNSMRTRPTAPMDDNHADLSTGTPFLPPTKVAQIIDVKCLEEMVGNPQTACPPESYANAAASPAPSFAGAPSPYDGRWRRRDVDTSLPKAANRSEVEGALRAVPSSENGTVLGPVRVISPYIKDLLPKLKLSNQSLHWAQSHSEDEAEEQSKDARIKNLEAELARLKRQNKMNAGPSVEDRLRDGIDRTVQRIAGSVDMGPTIPGRSLPEALKNADASPLHAQTLNATNWSLSLPSGIPWHAINISSPRPPQTSPQSLPSTAGRQPEGPSYERASISDFPKVPQIPNIVPDAPERSTMADAIDEKRGMADRVRSNVEVHRSSIRTAVHPIIPDSIIPRSLIPHSIIAKIPELPSNPFADVLNSHTGGHSMADRVKSTAEASRISIKPAVQSISPEPVFPDTPLPLSAQGPMADRVKSTADSRRISTKPAVQSIKPGPVIPEIPILPTPCVDKKSMADSVRSRRESLMNSTGTSHPIEPEPTIVHIPNASQSGFKNALDIPDTRLPTVPVPPVSKPPMTDTVSSSRPGTASASKDFLAPSSQEQVNVPEEQSAAEQVVDVASASIKSVLRTVSAGATAAAATIAAGAAQEESPSMATASSRNEPSDTESVYKPQRTTPDAVRVAHAPAAVQPPQPLKPTPVQTPPGQNVPYAAAGIQSVATSIASALR